MQNAKVKAIPEKKGTENLPLICIDTAAAALYYGAAVEDLNDLDLSYSPAAQQSLGPSADGCARNGRVTRRARVMENIVIIGSAVPGGRRPSTPPAQT